VVVPKRTGYMRNSASVNNAYHKDLRDCQKGDMTYPELVLEAVL